METLLTEFDVAGKKGNPGLVLFDPCSTSTITQLLGQCFGFTEKPVGVAQRPPEDFGETTFTK